MGEWAALTGYISDLLVCVRVVAVKKKRHCAFFFKSNVYGLHKPFPTRAFYIPFDANSTGRCTTGVSTVTLACTETMSKSAPPPLPFCSIAYVKHMTLTAGVSLHSSSGSKRQAGGVYRTGSQFLHEIVGAQRSFVTSYVDSDSSMPQAALRFEVRSTPRGHVELCIARSRHSATVSS